jgi:phosphosulfolactate phosphohydrolase-like enzyme
MSGHLDMVAVIAESRELATKQREASEDFLASAALKAIVEGEDVREIARLCGFDPDGEAATEPYVETVEESGKEYHLHVVNGPYDLTRPDDD